MSCQCPKIHWQVREDLWCNILKQYYVMLRTGFFEVIFEHITPLSFLQNSIHYEEVTHKLSKNIFRKWSMAPNQEQIASRQTKAWHS